MQALAQDPISFDSTAASLLEDAQNLISRTKNIWDQIVNSVKPESVTWANTILPIIQDENLKFMTVRVLRFYASSSPSQLLRDASSSAATMFNNLDVELYSRVDMFLLVDAVMQSASRDMDHESRHYLEKLHRRFFQNGCGLIDPSVKAHFEKCQKRLKEIERECNKNMQEEKTGVWFTLEELEGVPQTFIARFQKGEGVNEHDYWVATKVPQSSPVMKYATSESTRKKMFYAIQNRMPANIPLFRELILLRDETARILGYPNHASFKTADKMVGNPQIVEKLLFEIKTRLVPRGREFANDLLNLKRQEFGARGEVADTIYFWDQAYYRRVQSGMETPQTIDVSEYFELNHTLKTLLEMFENLFCIRFENVTPEKQIELGGGRPLIWQEDVLMYTVYGSNDSFIGYAYFDFYHRAGKYTHAGHYSLQPTWLRPDGTRFHPSSAVMMNYSKISERPTLLSLEEVRKLFHEIGHLIHALCTETRYAASHYVDRDFVEAPSLMLEQFFWQQRHIKNVSMHYSRICPSYHEMWRKTFAEGPMNTLHDDMPEKLPDDVVAALAKTSLNRKNVSDQLKELFFASYDMRIHSPSSHKELENLNLAETFNKMKCEILSLNGGEAAGDGWEWGHGETVFRNVINNYDAGYYSYILGRIFALDIFKTGFESDSTSKDAGRRYREMVLRFGGSQSELKTLTDYLGHQPSTKPYFEYLGITTGDDEFGPKQRKDDINKP